MLSKPLAALTAIALAVSISGCSTKTLEADERVVTLTTKRQIVGDVVDEFKVICPEASPDALTLLAASASGETRAGVNIAAAYSESGSNIGLRTHTIQILRDQLYSICQAYANHGLTAFGYQALIARNQRNTVLMMAIEQLTGVLKTPEVNITTTAEADASTLKSKSDELNSLKEKYKAIQDKTTDDAKEMAKNIDALELALKNYRGSLAKASGTTSSKQQNNSALDPQSVEAVVGAVERLATLVADTGAKEDNLMVCMQQLQSSELKSRYNLQKSVLDEACGKLLAEMAKESQLKLAIRNTSFKTIMDPASSMESMKNAQELIKAIQ
ncbi:hypothetical protein [Pseudomonas bharatica]|uniref:hypothetical protein n=1 Tax=Pseudomonas bharatica TaxID=2692112 RepID=UPI003B27F3B0